MRFPRIIALRWSRSNKLHCIRTSVWAQHLFLVLTGHCHRRRRFSPPWLLRLHRSHTYRLCTLKVHEWDEWRLAIVNLCDWSHRGRRPRLRVDLQWPDQAEWSSPIANTDWFLHSPFRCLCVLLWFMFSFIRFSSNFGYLYLVYTLRFFFFCS